VRPKFLVADTNCYIDHLDAMIRLIRDQKHYILIAPLVGKFYKKNNKIRRRLVCLASGFRGMPPLPESNFAGIFSVEDGDSANRSSFERRNECGSSSSSDSL